MLKFKDFKCDSHRNFWTGNVDMSKDDEMLNEINTWLRGKALTVINVETLQNSSRPTPFVTRLIRVWYND